MWMEREGAFSYGKVSILGQKEGLREPVLLQLDQAESRNSAVFNHGGENTRDQSYPRCSKQLPDDLVPLPPARRNLALTPNGLGRTGCIPLEVIFLDRHAFRNTRYAYVSKFIRYSVEHNRLRWLLGGIFLLGIGLYNFATYTVTSSQQSTFNIPSGQAEYLSKTEYPGNSVSGTFRETSGNLVSYYIMNSAQFASFQTGTSLSNVYSIVNVPSASVSYGFTTQDDYYFVFRHGTGLLNSTETVTYQRTYITHDNFRLYLGIFFIAFGAVELVVGFRRKGTVQAVPPFPIGQAVPPVFGTTPSTVPRYCKNCGQAVEQSATFCPSCG